MIYTIQNEDLIVKADSLGAELKSIMKKNDTDGIEYLWQLNPAIWERQAPLLFPIIGRLKDKEYIYQEKTYKIDIHGFARHKEFKFSKITESEFSFEISEDAETLNEYPFKFKLIINYRLSGNRIIKNHSIENTGQTDMLYEIGGHEGYNLALYDNEKMEDYYLEFPGMNHLKTYTADGEVMLNKDKKIVDLSENRLFLSPEVFEKDALIIDQFKTRRVSLRNLINNRGIDVEFNDFKYLGIWTKYMRSNYVCIEPWSSLPDCNYLGKELIEKQDIRTLKKGSAENLNYTITVI